MDFEKFLEDSKEDAPWPTYDFAQFDCNVREKVWPISMDEYEKLSLSEVEIRGTPKKVYMLGENEIEWEQVEFKATFGDSSKFFSLSRVMPLQAIYAELKRSFPELQEVGFDVHYDMKRVSNTTEKDIEAFFPYFNRCIELKITAVTKKDHSIGHEEGERARVKHVARKVEMICFFCVFIFWFHVEYRRP